MPAPCHTGGLNLRALAATGAGALVAGGLDRLNQRHPWSHNDAFHPWIMTRLPVRRSLAVDVGCGRGELVFELAGRFERVIGLDVDAGMRAAAQRRCAGLDRVEIRGERPGSGNSTPAFTSWEERGSDNPTPLFASLEEPVDLVTMVAVLHHLELREALAEVAGVLRAGGKFLCVGLARPTSVVDQAWDAASIVTNPVIGFVRHPWPNTEPVDREPFPVADPRYTVDEIRAALGDVMPGAHLSRHLGFRHTIEWTKP